MAKSNKSVTDWENAQEENRGEWESLSSGFAPLWKPESGNAIEVLPVGVHAFKVKKNAKIKTPSYAIECILKGGSLTNFYNGRGSAVSISIGDNVTIGSSYNLVGEDKLIVIEQSGKGKALTQLARLSRMSELLTGDNRSFRIVFNGQVKTEGARRVNDYTIQVPKGYKEKFSSQKG